MFPASFASAFVALFVAHQVADHWIQTDHQAATKGQPGHAGDLACLAHVFTYTLTSVVTLFAVRLTAGTELWDGPQLAVGLAVSAASHYLADRRPVFERIVYFTGQDRFYSLGRPRDGHDDNPSLGTGAYALDQSWHYAWLFVTALILAA